MKAQDAREALRRDLMEAARLAMREPTKADAVARAIEMTVEAIMRYDAGV